LAARVIDRLQGEFANKIELQSILWEDEESKLARVGPTTPTRFRA